MRGFKILSLALIFSLLAFANVPESAAMSRRIRRHFEQAKERHRRAKENHEYEEQSSSPSYKSDPNIGSYTMKLNCTPCGGSGRKHCMQCGGQGGHWDTVTVPHYSSKQRVSERVWKSCSSCNGSGTKPCSDCGGTGYIYQDNTGRRVR